MDADDARLVRIYTAPTGTSLESTTPNAATPTAATNFDVVIEGDAGSAKGVSGQPYNVRFDAQELTQPAASPGGYSSAIGGQSFSVASGWTLTVPGGDYSNTWRRTIAVAATDRGRMFQYTGSLITPDNGVVSFVQSDPFLIV